MMSRRRSGDGAADEQVAATWQCASLLLDYPGEQDLGAVRAVVPLLPPSAAEPLARFLAHVDATPLPELQEAYVATFDSRRRCNLFLTYFAHGDTRKRGMALLRFKQAYLASGMRLRDDELPDHLCVVLEYAATVDREQGRRLLLDHRAGLELLRISLHDAGSPWADVVEAVSATLPALRGDEREAVRRLAAEGPPEEEVGLTPALIDLPMPSVPVGARGRGV
jgi:nitrate reductase delta subunit